MSNFDVTVSPLLIYMELFYSLYIICSLYRQLNYAILHIQEFSLLSVLYTSSSMFTLKGAVCSRLPD